MSYVLCEKMPKIKIALLSGGVSMEREISLKTENEIYKALDKNKYKIFRYDTKIDLRDFINDALDKKFDLVFPALHGPFGEDGKLQGMLDIIGVPYLFSGCAASAIAMDKKKSKVIAADAGLDTAKDIVLEKGGEYNPKSIIEKLSLPIFIKPLELGSSVGMSKANTEDELEKGIKKAFKYGNKIILEKFIKGRELSAPVMDFPPKALPVIEIIPKKSDWFDFKAKYEVGAAEEVCPAKIPDNIRDEAQAGAIKIFKAIGCKDLARVDFIWNEKENKIYFLEINTIPGMTATSLAPQSARAAGMEFGKFLDRLITNSQI